MAPATPRLAPAPVLADTVSYCDRQYGIIFALFYSSTCPAHLIGGPSCAEKRCGGSFAWFGDVNADHSTVKTDGSVDCSGVGTCDTATGTCTYVPYVRFFKLLLALPFLLSGPRCLQQLRGSLGNLLWEPLRTVLLPERRHGCLQVRTFAPCHICFVSFLISCCISCSNNGACLTMSEIGRLRYDDQKQLAVVTYDAPWDAQ